MTLHPNGNMSLSARIGLGTGPFEPNGCRLWKGATDKWGYGRTSHNGKSASVARVILGLSVGDQRRACHHCDNPLCVHPQHLYAGTASDNMYDSVRRKRHVNARKTHCNAGHPFDEINTGPDRKGDRTHRRCRRCSAAATARYLARKVVRP